LTDSPRPSGFPGEIPFVEGLGIRLVRLDTTGSTLEMDLTYEQTNSWNVAHGGVLMTLLDVAMAMAARGAVPPGDDPPPPGAATIEMKTSFMRPARGRLRAEAKVLHRTRSIAFCEATVFDADGAACAAGNGTFKYLSARAHGALAAGPGNGGGTER